MNPAGFWFIVKAAMLAQGAGQQQILDYGKKKYIRYHNSEDGWSDIVAQAKASTSIMPPAGFTVTQYVPPSPGGAGGRPGEEQESDADELCGVGACPVVGEPTGC